VLFFLEHLQVRFIISYISMKIITPTGSQTINVIFRPTAQFTDVTLQIRSRSTNKVKTYSNILPISNNNYYNVDITQVMKDDLVQNNYYDLTIFTGTTLLVRETLFVTDQTQNQVNNEVYNPNKDKYKPVESTNEYIIL